jgi:hypothetical protein
MNNYEKYLKYKNKYLQLKKLQLGGVDTVKEIANILIVVDVQNCFIEGGSFGGETKNQKLVEEITNLIDKANFDYIVVTRDMHPAHHSSHMLTGKTPNNVVVVEKKEVETPETIEISEFDALLNSLGKKTDYKPLGGPWPPHCRVTNDEVKNIGKCGLREKEIDMWDFEMKNEKNIINGRKIIGNHVAHYYNSEHPIIKYFYNPDMKLGITDIDGEQNKNPSEVSYYLNVIRNIETIKTESRPPILQVFKGQLCEWDAYSAFQYHADFKIGPYVNDVEGNLANTTCLAEVLFSEEYGIKNFVPNVKKVNIVVCGLVGEVCVKYTVSYGINLLSLAKNSDLQGYSRLKSSTDEILKQINIKSLDINFIYSSYATRFIPNPFLIDNIQNEIEKRKNEVLENNITYDLLLNVENAKTEKFIPSETDLCNVIKLL